MHQGADQPWVSCVLSDMLISYVEDACQGAKDLDLSLPFRGVEGLEAPADPGAFLQDVGNWVPLQVLRALHGQCERVSSRKDIAYLAARAYFAPRRRDAYSLFDILFRVLNDMRAVLMCSSLWAGVHTTHLRLQSFETPAPERAVNMLAQFGPGALPAIGSIDLIRGYAEGFSHLFPSGHAVRCREEISQLRLEDLIAEFPDVHLERRGDRLTVKHRGSGEVLVEAQEIS
ncbi:MAG TPA: hypothetical protein VN648_34980, partial [Candidatus Methylomirabilis sp.]|nr:hypothetical protein [Candidatus Methylomirabilis sp.]